MFFRQLGNNQFMKPVLISLPQLVYPVICNEQDLTIKNSFCRVLRRFPTTDEQRAYEILEVSIEDYTLLSKLYEEHPIIKEANKFTWLDMLYTMNHVKSSTFVMDYTTENVLKIVDGLHSLQNMYPFMGIPCTEQTIHMPAKSKYKLMVTLYNLSATFLSYNNSPKEGIAVAIELDSNLTSRNNEPGYGEYYVFAEEKSPFFYIDGETLINTHIEINEQLLYWVKKKNKKSTPVAKEIKFDTSLLDELVEAPVEEPEVSLRKATKAPRKKKIMKAHKFERKRKKMTWKIENDEEVENDVPYYVPKIEHLEKVYKGDISQSDYERMKKQIKESADYYDASNATHFVAPNLQQIGSPYTDADLSIASFTHYTEVNTVKHKF